MRLITEQIDTGLEFLVEERNGTKSFYIKGPFAQAETLNKNGRVYPRHIMEREVNRYNTNYVQTNRAMGQLGHPDSPAIDLDRVSHVIKEFKMQGNTVYGKAKLLDTPCGNIAKGLMEGGVTLGVSTRGVGSLKESGGRQIVQEDFQMSTVDIVGDPSGKDCYVQGIYEGAEWIYDPKHGWKANRLAENHRKIINSTKMDEEKTLKLFEQFMNTLKG